ncbi:unnamed protein product [Nippostrongylus brasiliensis]|uniref:TMEM135_C_rich domain-containing protein n=1 Tax=Nippostrongylus brasiliensis TaxID=27835 RepID=A0A158QY63_NIPBR|nr:unnamed protein product [Nippostrongylus brasiliensis]
MAILSKLAHNMGLQILTTNCYETIHTWEPDCYKAILVASPNGFLFSLKTYLTFYLRNCDNILPANENRLHQIHDLRASYMGNNIWKISTFFAIQITTMISKKGDPRKVDWKRFGVDVLRSSIFLTTNLLLFQFFLCRIRHLLGFFTIPTMGLISSAMASFCAILIEKQARRPALALYTTNLASETLFRQLCNHGYLSHIKYGECIPFAIGIGLFAKLQSQGTLDPSIQKLLNYTHCIKPDEEILSSKWVPNDFHVLLRRLRNDFGRSPRCVHKHSCASTAIESFVRNFAIGTGVSALLVFVRNLKNIFSNPLKVARLLLSWSNLRLPLFFGLLPLLFHVSHLTFRDENDVISTTTRCLLNRVPFCPVEVSETAAGVISGFSMLPYRSVTIAMYTMWKGIEVMYRKWMEQGLVPSVPYGDIILYTISTGYVLWQTVIEPQALRKGYLNFLLGITGNRIKVFNRDLYEHFGFQSKLLYPNAKPQLNTRYCTLNPMLYQGVMPC